MTHDIIKLMYERDHLHATATQSNDSKLWQDYRNLRNKVTCIIKERKNVCFNDIHTLCKWPKKRSEIKLLIPGKKNRILLVIFLRMISNTILSILATKWTQNFKLWVTIFSGKAQKIFIIFVSIKCLMKILKHIWDLHLINPVMIYWKWTSFYWEYVPISLANVINESLKSGIFEHDWKNARVTHIYTDDGDINDKNNYRQISVIDHIAKMIESLVSYQIIDIFGRA